MKTVGDTARRFALTTLACAVVLVAAGAVFAAATGEATRGSVASALFIGAALLISLNALGETGFRDRGFDLGSSSANRGRLYPGAGSTPQGTFGWVLVGVALTGFGVLILVL
jgi:hypothetical protein